MDVFQFAFSLCAIPSVTGQEKEVCNFLESYLRQQGYVVRKIPVSGERYNILALPQEQSHVKVVYCSHLDTVPPFIEPVFRANGAELWGRGTCDAKGIVAAMVEAGALLRTAGHVQFALLFVVGEETNSDGAKVAAKELKGFADFVICGEPTQMQAASFQKGTLVFTLRAQGQEAHSSVPAMGRSAVHLLLEVAHQLLNYPWPHSKEGETLLNIGVFQGGTAANMLAGQAMLQGIFRLTTEAGEIAELLQKLLPPNVHLEISSQSSPVQLHVPAGIESFVAGFGSDVPYLKEIGTPVLVGPCPIGRAHTVDEYISFEELKNAVGLYEQLYNQLERPL